MSTAADDSVADKTSLQFTRLPHVETVKHVVNEGLASAGAIKCLRFSHCAFGAGGVEGLKCLQDRLSAQLRLLSESTPGNNPSPQLQISELAFEYCDLDDGGAKEVVKLLRLLPRLQRLSLRNNAVGWYASCDILDACRGILDRRDDAASATIQEGAAADGAGFEVDIRQNRGCELPRGMSETDYIEWVGRVLAGKGLQESVAAVEAGRMLVRTNQSPPSGSSSGSSSSGSATAAAASPSSQHVGCAGEKQRSMSDVSTRSGSADGESHAGEGAAPTTPATGVSAAPIATDAEPTVVSSDGGADVTTEVAKPGPAITVLVTRQLPEGAHERHRRAFVYANPLSTAERPLDRVNHRLADVFEDWAGVLDRSRSRGVWVADDLFPSVQESRRFAYALEQQLERHGQLHSEFEVRGYPQWKAEQNRRIAVYHTGNIRTWELHARRDELGSAYVCNLLDFFYAEARSKTLMLWKFDNVFDHSSGTYEIQEQGPLASRTELGKRLYKPLRALCAPYNPRVRREEDALGDWAVDFERWKEMQYLNVGSAEVLLQKRTDFVTLFRTRLLPRFGLGASQSGGPAAGTSLFGSVPRSVRRRDECASSFSQGPSLPDQIVIHVRGGDVKDRNMLRNDAMCSAFYERVVAEMRERLRQGTAASSLTPEPRCFSTSCYPYSEPEERGYFDFQDWLAKVEREVRAEFAPDGDDRPDSAAVGAGGAQAQGSAFSNQCYCSDETVMKIVEHARKHYPHLADSIHLVSNGDCEALARRLSSSEPSAGGGSLQVRFSRGSDRDLEDMQLMTSPSTKALYIGDSYFSFLAALFTDPEQTDVWYPGNGMFGLLGLGVEGWDRSGWRRFH